MIRRKFIKKSILGIFGAGLITGFYSWQIEPFWLEFVHIKMPIKNLPDSLQGKTLMQISDMHVKDSSSCNYLVESFKEAQNYHPDFVVYTGDFVSYIDHTQIERLKVVMTSAVKGSLGTWAVLGNHDYGWRWSQPDVANAIVDILENSKITTLRNTQDEKHGLNVIGIDDYWAINFKPEKVMTMLDQEKANIVLCHNPDVCDLDIWNGYKGWILSGHTHGGQVKPPFVDPPVLPVKNKRYNAGKIPLNDHRTLYINRALGYLHQVRLNVRPEITLFELISA